MSSFLVKDLILQPNGSYNRLRQRNLLQGFCENLLQQAG